MLNQTTKNNNFIDFFNPVPKVLAHRGDSIFFPENTMPAFLSAESLGVDVIETDVHISADNRVVIWHDDSLERVSNYKGKINEFTYEQLKQIDPGYNFTRDNGASYPFRNKGLQIIELQELLERLPNMRFNIDLKTLSTELVKKTIEILKATSSIERVCIGSFHNENIKLIRELCPNIITSFSPGEIKKYIIQHKLRLFWLHKNFKAKSFMVPERHGKINIVTKSFIKAIHKKGLYIHVWTINNEKEMRRLLDLGVDGIFTDHPKRLINLIYNRD